MVRMFDIHDRVNCSAFGVGHITRLTEDGRGMFVKFHGELGQEMIYWRNGQWREVTEDTYYDLSHASAIQISMTKMLEASLWLAIGYLLSFPINHFGGM